MIANWLRNRNTIEYLGIWEQLYNPNFKPAEFEGVRRQAGLNAFSLRAEEQEQMRRDDERERMQYEMAERESIRKHELEKHRADAIAGVARAYLEQERRTVYYVW